MPQVLNELGEQMAHIKLVEQAIGLPIDSATGIDDDDILRELKVHFEPYTMRKYRQKQAIYPTPPLPRKMLHLTRPLPSISPPSYTKIAVYDPSTLRRH